MEICLWCTFKRENVVELLEQYVSGSLSSDEYQTATEDLNNCAECVSQYHLARTQVPHLHKRLWALETTRLMERFSQLSRDELDEDDLFLVEDNEEKTVSKMTMDEFELALRIPFTEILQFPYLLAHDKLSELCLDALCRADTIGMNEKYKGIYLLLVHPNDKVRSWAIRTAQMLGPVDRDEFYDVEEVLACMFCVLELGISFSLEDSDPPSACVGKLLRMPSHLYDSSNVKNYWLGICMLLTVLDKQAMDSLFLGPNKQTNILQCILNTMEGEGREFDSSADPFWPALQCFMVILDRLGPNIWGYIEPIKALHTITYSTSYTSEIQTIRSNLSRSCVNVKEEQDDEHQVSCSQMVYETFLQPKLSRPHRSGRTEEFDQQLYKGMASLVGVLQTELGQEMHLYNSTFLWFIPFVRSVMNMDELSIHYVQPVVQYLGDQVSQMFARNAVWDKVTVFFAYLLVHVVEMLLTEGQIKILHACSNIWVKVIGKGAVFANVGAGEFRRRELSVSSSSMTGSARPAGGALSSMSSILHLACLKVIRLVLKEGGRLGSDIHPRARYFLNQLNIHLRDSVRREGWSLSVPELQELQQCLKQLVAALEKKATTAPATVSALPTPPAETVAMESPFANQDPLSFIKKEPMSNPVLCGSPMRDMDCTVNATPIKDELTVGFQNLKPDLGKLQVIRSCLNENLPKMQAIAQKKPVGEEGVAPRVLHSGEKKNPESPRPLPSNSYQESHRPEEDSSSDDDYVPLNVMQRRIIQEKGEESWDESNVNVIVISDEDMASINGVESGDDLASGFEIKKEQVDMVESPGRDFDVDLSESQVFEFETQEDVASAWGDTHFEFAIPKAGSSKSPSSAGFETEFVKPKSAPQKAPQKAPSKKSKPLPPPVIEAQPLRKKWNRGTHPVAQVPNVEATVDAPSTSRVHSSTPAIVPPKKVPNVEATVDAPSTSRVHSSTPAIVPPKKVRTASEPESTVERLGLKKRKRMAFDLSQRSLDCVGQLRRYGQTVQVEKNVKRLRTAKPAPAHKAKGKNQKLLASQEMQFHRQSRNQQQKTSATSPTKHSAPLSPTLQAQKAKPCIGEADQLEGDEKKGDSDDANMQSCDLDQRSKGGGGGDGTPIGGIAEANDNNKEEYYDDFDDYNWNLTLMDPTDMEMCSQMEQFDEENDEDQSVFLTQRDPVDMDIDEDEPLSTMQSLPGDQPDQTIQLPSLPQPPMVQTPSTVHQSDDSLFLKPGMSPMSQKRARPSTTKIYTPSSRNDTLVKDMEKLPTPKLKVAHKALMPPPPAPPPQRLPPAQPELRLLPLPKPPPRPPQITEPCHKPAPQPPPKPAPQPAPTYKTYPRPEASTSSGRPAPFTHNLKASILKAKVLKWQYSWFQNYKQFGPPEDLCDLPLKNVPKTFDSFPDYYHTFFPLLVTNTFEELASEWLREDRIRLNLKVQSVDYGSLDTGLFTVTNANFIANLTPQEESQQQYPKEDDVVILWLPQNTASYGHVMFNDEPRPDCQAHFGVVARSNVIYAGAKRELKLKIQTCGNVLSINKQLVKCEVIGSMLSAMRELSTLCHMHDKALMRTILAPTVYYANFLPASTQLDSESMVQGCNVDQAKAIDCGVSMVMSKQPTPKICLIHGPPGTGKSDTIVNMLHRLSQVGAADPSGQKHLHALVCAPSNSAVDNLMKKIIVFFKEKIKDGKPKGNCGDVNLVRLGSERTICAEVVAFSLDRQTKSRTEKAQHQAKGIEQKIAELEQNMQNLTHMCAMTKDPVQLAQLRNKNLKLNEERERLSQQMKLCKSGKQNTQRVILQEANIICCTLSTSGSVVLESAFRRRGRVPFNCVIIDEAGQAKEMETLIPLLFRCPSLVLVGDPDQLPPTVISQKAKELGYDQSLMARLFKCIHRLSPPRIHFLSQQYRMHPDICSFPSKYIYNNILKTDRMIAQNRCSSDWACESYRLFDVTDGQEMREKDSYFNPKEVKLTIELVQLVTERYQLRPNSQSLRGVIGVITPYSGQKFRIREALRKNHLPKVVVDTVDGFQGREMDCIIVSCVRASNEMGSIGFLGNRQRMNVTITRAKYSLFVLGNLRTLREHSDWKALIEDAESRGTIITTKEQHFKNDARKVFKRDALSPPPHRTQDRPPHPSGRAQFLRSNSTPPFPNPSRASSMSRAPQPTERSRDRRSSSTTSDVVPSRATPSTTARGQNPADRPRDPRSGSTSSDAVPSRVAPSTTTARGQNPADRPRDPRLQGSSSNAAPSWPQPQMTGRDRRGSYERDRQRPCPPPARCGSSRSGSSSSTFRRSSSPSYSRKGRL
ncbi:probable helicase senataxin isoform X1 [Clupea harengus]|uniref:Probable helicase senataxin isoform X1 n=1 Tax=Clupea harengus TaxID=7950 RepID=A0A6P8GG88_CLUHA|nr:probable helicase senataxin isoform X1 [Clupea harengus]XP_031433951.1 probable helicase senataxin isoform X1 [Clupea harengus]XP_031433952.1 probable helicase senataxin isoform X1 [Clupea harengus]XP_031433953.1 probable helicase senataxin isoform X1 [Clupea harengus]